MGLSVISGSQEVAYARASGISARYTQTLARSTAEVCVQNLQASNLPSAGSRRSGWVWESRGDDRCLLAVQVDNTLQAATYWVMLACPTVPLRVGIGIVADTPSTRHARSAALTGRAAAWRRRPAGVLCIELLEVLSFCLRCAADCRHWRFLQVRQALE